jgi:cell volume regulation protein A
VLLARPIAVALSVAWFRTGWRDQAFLSWAGLRGAVPIVLATIPLSLGVPEASKLFDIIFVLVVIFTVAQGSTIAPVARRLGVTALAEANELRVETAPLDRMRADLLELEIPTGSQLAGVYVDELRLPPGAVVTMVMREEVGFVPHGRTRLRVGDALLIVATEDTREAAEQRLRAISRRGRLARWLGEEGTSESP